MPMLWLLALLVAAVAGQDCAAGYYNKINSCTSSCGLCGCSYCTEGAGYTQPCADIQYCSGCCVFCSSCPSGYQIQSGTACDGTGTTNSVGQCVRNGAE